MRIENPCNLSVDYAKTPQTPLNDEAFVRIEVT